MNKVLKVLGIAIAIVAIAIAVLLFGMRFSDGPIEILSGGPFKTGELSEAPADWSFLKDRSTIEFQTMDPETSRTVWLATHDSKLYLVSGYMTATYGGIWKKWPHYLEDDDRIILRIDGKLYEQRLERIMTGSEVGPVMAEFSRKYFPGGSADTAADIETVASGYSWLYEVVER